jgi:flavin reductase (DIM6/NTAB) family NADH-FMN oxidoreductase RutF
MSVPQRSLELSGKMELAPPILRDVLGNFPTGVAVVTAAGGDGSLFGVTVSSFNSVSLNPPLVLFSLSRQLLSLPGIVRAEAFAINFLRDDQQHLSARFAAPLSDKWQGVEFRAGHTGSPILVPALAVLECRPYAQYDGGDHVIVVGRVTNVEADSARHPLVFFRGSYHTLSRAERPI